MKEQYGEENIRKNMKAFCWRNYCIVKIRHAKKQIIVVVAYN